MPNLTDDLVVKVLCHPAASKVFVGDRNLEVSLEKTRANCILLGPHDLIFLILTCRIHPCTNRYIYPCSSITHL